MNIHHLLSERFTLAVQAMGIEDAAIPLSRSTKPDFGEYQFNGAMALAKRLKQKPRDIAQQILEHVSLDDVAEKLEIAGPGFINIYLKNDWLSAWCESALSDAKLTVSPHKRQRIVVDYSSPNLAKEMHVGHLRSTIIGDAVVNVLEFLGHHVIRQNHMGDWGTQFGMLLAHLSDELKNASVAETALSDLEDFYRAAKVRFDNEDGFADRAREYVVKLQGGDVECLALWQQFIDISITHSEEVYQKLNVGLSRKDVMGESSYNPDLPVVIADLSDRNIAVEDQGAKVVFIPEMSNKDGDPAVYIVQKSGGGYLYATTDLAAIRYRSKELKADRTLIFTDARQALHFKQTEIVARKAAYLREDESYEHCPFGMMLGKDGKPFKTRSGATIKLSDLLDEAIERADVLISQRESSLSDADKKQVAATVGIGAVKYADLSKNRTTDYILDWDTMLSFEGNTAPYLQYAVTRVKSIFRKAEADLDTYQASVRVASQQEHDLVVKMMQFDEVLESVAKDATPHVICTYLYEVASLFMRFYEANPILKSDVTTETRQSRLALAALCARTLETGLNILGISTLDAM
ncbi:arginine--tRNA ligase [Glaciecola sp. MH2013]|uniref:arginine--tRNA ligase n=1 Tax=Glaciecola sp. MH2013 TaxID=2785524 RepID=UPI00189D6222|nr:arginine--tRNA ligase [Glaciecola sp. MH2013]MBF7072455.1 arginine--tRNA ligase [Glaciecola sp. MH2013]